MNTKCKPAQSIKHYAVYDMKTNSMKNPLGTDRPPVFSWKTKSDIQGAKQTAYRIKVASDSAMTDIVWDSKKVISDCSVGIKYEGSRSASSKYYWQVTLWNERGEQYQSGISEFETGLMGTGKSVWSGAEWITFPRETFNTFAAADYDIEADFRAENGKIGFVAAARNKDNYTLIEIDMDNRTIASYERCDNASPDKDPVITKREGVSITEKMIAHGSERADHHIKISIRDGYRAGFEFDKNGVYAEAALIPQDIPNLPRKSRMMLIGIKQDVPAVISRITIKDTKGHIYIDDDFSSPGGIAQRLGTVRNGKLEAGEVFELINPVPSLTVRRTFSIKKPVKSARLYSSAHGFYNAYINGKKINCGFYNPGFTDYRLRIQYQTYDVTDLLRSGENMIGAVVAKGYWSGFCGYSGAQVYGTQSAFICRLIINYEDGSCDIIVTDKSWKYTDKTPFIDADYLDGETYDARLSLDGWGEAGYDDSSWMQCGIRNWSSSVIPSNGTLSGVSFKMTAQESPQAKIEMILSPVSAPSNPRAGHYIFDFGQNMVGTVRLRLKGSRGDSVKIRYGEMCDKEGNLYTANLRTAANTDVYILSGEKDGEEFIPSFTAHGFRYAEITGNGYRLDDINIVERIEGLVINNLDGVTGGFKCSNEAINKLQSNIQWGERGNSLLVLTDCPQRNERMGWTGDAQAFIKTGAYNMDMKAFGEKWLLDAADAQLMYNKNGAVPDTAPLGGDNRSDGCRRMGRCGCHRSVGAVHGIR